MIVTVEIEVEVEYRDLGRYGGEYQTECLTQVPKEVETWAKQTAIQILEDRR